MILGLGTDLAHIPSLADQLNEPGSVFIAVFTDREIRDANAHRCSVTVTGGGVDRSVAVTGSGIGRVGESAGSETGRSRESTSGVRESAGGLGRFSVQALHSLAGRWAAKEAFVKAWSAVLQGQAPPIDPQQLVWSEIEVVSDRWKRPSLRFSGQVASVLARTCPARWHVSISHDGDYAMAVVMAEEAVVSEASDSTYQASEFAHQALDSTQQASETAKAASGSTQRDSDSTQQAWQPTQ